MHDGDGHLNPLPARFTSTEEQIDHNAYLARISADVPEVVSHARARSRDYDDNDSNPANDAWCRDYADIGGEG